MGWINDLSSCDPGSGILEVTGWVGGRQKVEVLDPHCPSSTKAALLFICSKYRDSPQDAI